jgi:TPP-dependent trihydroxycyclohexane-1,2-dione (THcHDO) dehydratase
MWTTERRGGYHAEYGYSCMGYEVATALDVKSWLLPTAKSMPSSETPVDTGHDGTSA